MKGFCIEYRLKGEGQLSESAGVALGGGDLPARFLTIVGEARAELEPPKIACIFSGRSPAPTWQASESIQASHFYRQGNPRLAESNIASALTMTLTIQHAAVRHS